MDKVINEFTAPTGVKFTAVERTTSTGKKEYLILADNKPRYRKSHLTGAPQIIKHADAAELNREFIELLNL